MKKIKQGLRRFSGREVNASEAYDLNANSTGVRGSTSTVGQAEDERRPWGLKELFSGRDPMVELVLSCPVR